MRVPDPVVFGFLMEELDRLEGAGCKLHYLQGQHELNRQRPWLSCHHMPAHLHKNLIEYGDITMYGLDYQPPDLLKEELLKIPKQTDIFLAHQVWRERMGGQARGEDRPADGAFADIPRLDMLISGDFHAHRTTKHKGKDGQDITAVSPGTPYMKTLDEDQDKYFYVLNTDRSLSSIKLQTRPVIRDRAATVDSLTKAVDLMKAFPKFKDPQDPDKPIWHVVYNENIPGALDSLQKTADGRAHLFDRPFVVKAGEEEVLVEHETDNSLDFFLSKRCDPESSTFKSASRLLEAGRFGKDRVRHEIAAIVRETVSNVAESTKGWNTGDDHA